MKTPPYSLPARLSAAILSVSLLATAASQAAPLVTFDVIAVPVGLTGSSTPSLSISPDGLAVQFASGTHADVLLRLVATPNSQNGNPNDEAFARVLRSFVTFGTTGDLTGSLRGDALTSPGVNNVSPFRSTLGPIPSASGSSAELSGLIPGNLNDSILDLGGSGTAVTTTYPGYFRAQAETLPTVAGVSFILGETLLSLDGTDGSTSIQFVPRTGVAGITNRQMVEFTLDGVFLVRNGDGSPVNGAPDPTAFAFHSVTISTAPVPEPGAITLLLGGMLALGARRRRRA